MSINLKVEMQHYYYHMPGDHLLHYSYVSDSIYYTCLICLGIINHKT